MFLEIFVGVCHDQVYTMGRSAPFRQIRCIGVSKNKHVQIFIDTMLPYFASVASIGGGKYYVLSPFQNGKKNFDSRKSNNNIMNAVME